MQRTNATQDHVMVLTADQVSQVSGGIKVGEVTRPLHYIQPLLSPEAVAQDAYGDTMSGWDWMNWTAQPHDPTNGNSIHDFPGGRGQQ